MGGKFWAYLSYRDIKLCLNKTKKRNTTKTNKPHKHAVPFSSPAVSLWYFLDGQPDLVAEVSACVHHPERALSQHHPLAMLVVLIVVLWGQKSNSDRDVH